MIEFDDVSFAYRAPAEGAGAPEGVRGIDLRVEAGRCVLVCGASGCGKTTVTRLANGLAPSFFPGTLEGRVLVDGRDVADLESWEVAACVGSVFQNPRTQFFNVDSTGEVAFSLESMAWPEERIRERTHDTIRQLGLEELADRSIFELSGGEKQRVSIARAILKDAPIIILDEATASVDPENEAELQAAIDELTQDKTIIMIAHRLKTVRHADQILVLADGHIVQQGSHEELIAQPGIYADFIGMRREAIGWKLA